MVSLTAAVLCLCSLGSTAAAAQSILTISVSGNPGTVTINTAVPGLNPTSATDASTTYTITVVLVSPLKNKHVKITGQLNQNMPAGTTLTASLAAPPGGTSLGAVSLSTVAQDLVNGITAATAQTQSITYTLSATPGAGVVALTSRTVTFSLVTY